MEMVLLVMILMNAIQISINVMKKQFVRIQLEVSHASVWRVSLVTVLVLMVPGSLAKVVLTLMNAKTILILVIIMPFVITPMEGTPVTARLI